MIYLVIGALLAIAGGVYYTKRKKSASNNTQPLNTAPKVIVSQDTWDSDNYSMVEIAGRLHTAGIINLVAVDISGRDTVGKSGSLFRSILPPDVSVFLNHHGDTRNTPTGSRYPEISNYTTDTIPDSQRPNIDAMAELIAGTTGDITYIAGGHVDNLERLVRNHKSVITAKFKSVVLSSGWNGITTGKPEMNLSQGVKTPTPTAESTKYVFANLPQSIKLVIGTDPKSKLLGKEVDISFIKSTALLYLVTHGTYYKGKGFFKPGDFTALMYGVYGDNFGDAHMFDDIEVKMTPTKWGAIKAKSAQGTNRFYIKNAQSDAWFVELFTQHLRVGV